MGELKEEVKAEYMMIFFVFVFILFFGLTSNAVAVCSSYTGESACESVNCFWCERCYGKEISSYGTDRCVASSLDCSYSCSKTCDADCKTDAECRTNLTDTDCFYDGTCSACSCLYERAGCPKNGTVTGVSPDEAGVCYFGARSCTSTGCSISRCTLKEGEICHPDDGCKVLDEDRRCVGDDVFGKKATYFCRNSQCNYTVSNFIENCRNGCEDGKCKELCNIDGINTDCNEFDGYYGGRYCKGNDVYANYLDYRCGTNECTYDAREMKQESCAKCENGRCAGSWLAITNYSGTDKPVAPNVAQELNLVPPFITHPGARLYNGILFGSNEILLDVEKSRSGRINFVIRQSNRVGALAIQDKENLLYNYLQPGSYSIPFYNSTDKIRIYAASSGWIFFMPTVYDVRSVSVVYGDYIPSAS